MKTLELIQKTFRVFKILSKVAMILSFVACGLVLIALASSVVWYSGGRVIGLELETLQELTHTFALNQMIGGLLADAVFALTDGILFLFAFRYFSAEQEEGTPFTQSGADKIRSLGIQNIVLPLLAAILAAVIYGCFGLDHTGGWNDGANVALGILLILASLVFRYGAELETRTK